MDQERFDQLTRTLASGQSRRGVLKGLTGMAVGGLLAAVGIGEASAKPEVPCKAPNHKCGKGRYARCCTSSQVCTDGACTTPPLDPCLNKNCDDGNECTIDTCTSDGRCLYTLRSGSCNGGAGTCDNGTCVTSGCPAGTTSCNGMCKNLSSDPTNCGHCGTLCPGFDSCNSAVCTGGTCAGTTPRNEGGACSATGTCQSGTCVSSGGCPPGSTSCNGTCRYLSGDPTNCGACGTVCSGNGPCSLAVCTRGTCGITPTNEGISCTTASGSGTCQSGTCVPRGCGAGQTNCGSGCVDLSSDVNNCGACGSPCVASNECNTATCSQGECFRNSNPNAQGQPCASGTGTCDSNGNCDATLGGPGTCAANSDYCLTGTVVTCNGSPGCRCSTTAAGAFFCAGGGASCFDCNSDADCVSAGYPAGSACIDLGTNCSSCASSTPTHACVRPCGA